MRLMGFLARGKSPNSESTTNRCVVKCKDLRRWGRFDRMSAPRPLLTASHSPILDYDSSDEYRPEPVPPPQAPAWRDGSVRIGIYTSIANGFAGLLDRRREAGLQCAADFLRQPADVAPRWRAHPGDRDG